MICDSPPKGPLSKCVIIFHIFPVARRIGLGDHQEFQVAARLIDYPVSEGRRYLNPPPAFSLKLVPSRRNLDSPSRI